MTNDRDHAEAMLDDFEDHPENWGDAIEVPAAPDDAPRPKLTVAIRLDAKDVDRVRHHAEAEGVGYTTLLRRWVLERLDSRDAGHSGPGPSDLGLSHDDVLAWSYTLEKATKALRDLMAHHTHEDLEAARGTLSMLGSMPTLPMLPSLPTPLVDTVAWLRRTPDKEAFVDGLMALWVQALLRRHGVPVGEDPQLAAEAAGPVDEQRVPS
ncbi:hypothetical protein BH23ACT9_BH23ACT9_34620 [soil metagenome]